MGKLHKIRRKLAKLSDKDRTKLKQRVGYGYGIWGTDLRYPSYRNSHNNYLKKLFRGRKAQ